MLLSRTLAAAVMTVTLGTVVGCMPTARHAGARVIHHGDLVVEVMEPGAPDRYNRGVRFTPVAAVLSARYAGVEYLFNPIEHDAVEDHAGLAAEFDLVTPDSPDEWMPPGYHEARSGEGFVKIGLGVLRKRPQRYSLFQQPSPMELALTTAEWHDDHVIFTQSCQGVNGYGYELSAIVRCDRAALIVDWKLTNTGVKAFTTRQYIHNFVRIGDRDVGPGYVLQFPYAVNATGLNPEQTQTADSILFERRIPRWVNIEIATPPTYDGPKALKVIQTDLQRSVTCATSLPIFRTAVHARAGYVSPEQFIQLYLAPGDTRSWRRAYHFQ